MTVAPSFVRVFAHLSSIIHIYILLVHVKSPKTRVFVFGIAFLSECRKIFPVLVKRQQHISCILVKDINCVVKNLNAVYFRKCVFYTLNICHIYIINMNLCHIILSKQILLSRIFHVIL